MSFQQESIEVLHEKLARHTRIVKEIKAVLEEKEPQLPFTEQQQPQTVQTGYVPDDFWTPEQIEKRGDDIGTRQYSQFQTRSSMTKKEIPIGADIVVYHIPGVSGARRVLYSEYRQPPHLDPPFDGRDDASADF